jgi:hypothetical protein
MTDIERESYVQMSRYVQLCVLLSRPSPELLFLDPTHALFLETSRYSTARRLYGDRRITSAP